MNIVSEIQARFAITDVVAEMVLGRLIAEVFCRSSLHV
jgi:hypothetical protein